MQRYKCLKAIIREFHVHLLVCCSAAASLVGIGKVMIEKVVEGVVLHMSDLTAH